MQLALNPPVVSWIIIREDQREESNPQTSGNAHPACSWEALVMDVPRSSPHSCLCPHQPGSFQMTDPNISSSGWFCRVCSAQVRGGACSLPLTAVLCTLKAACCSFLGVSPPSAPLALPFPKVPFPQARAVAPLQAPADCSFPAAPEERGSRSAWHVFRAVVLMAHHVALYGTCDV